MPVSNDTHFHILQTKLYPPRVPGRLVLRRHLIERLDDGQNDVTLVSAPAGYGKSTLVTQWLEEGDKQYAWLSLDSYDSDLETVVSYIIAALRQAAPGLESETENLLLRQQTPTPERLAESLIMDLQAMVDPLFLVLDDYHTMTAKEIHDFMARFMTRLSGMLRLVLITRADPPLPLARMRGSGRLREVRGMDLRFTEEEAAELIEQIAGEAVDARTAGLLTERTEGWPVGLRMAAMSYRNVQDKASYAASFSDGSQKMISNYLLGEVLKRLDNRQRLLLLRTSIVDRLSAPLIDVLNDHTIPGISGYDLLEFLWSANFFLIALDGQGTWYRYHHLFRQMLFQQLNQVFSEEAVAEMHLQASNWFDGAGFIEDAIIHAIKAGDSELAGKLVEKHVHAAVNQEEWRVVDRWVNLLPEEACRRPGILAIRAMLEQFRFRMGAMKSLLDEAQEGLGSGEYDYSEAEVEAWMGVINAFRATNFVPTNSPRESLIYAQRAMQQVESRAVYVRSVADLWYIYALQQSGKPQEAIQLARRNLADQTGPPDVRTNRLMVAQGAVYYCEADVYGARNMAQAFLKLALRTKHKVSQGWAYFMLGWSYYQTNDLDRAERYFQGAVAARHQIHVRTAVDCITGLALIYNARGEQSQVQKTLALLRNFVMEQGGVAMFSLPDSLAMHLIPAVSGEGNVRHLKVHLQSQLASDTWELPILTACKIEILRGGANLDAAEGTLTKCEAFARARNAKRQILQIGALRALLCDARGETKEAMQHLREMVLLGEATGALRIFVDCTPELRPLFSRLGESGVAPSYIKKILMALPGETPQWKSEAPQSTLSPQAVALMADLTNREMEVLLLLSERLTNKEIAAKLHISPRTVKKYTINLYSKLDVKHRRQAVARAREIGIINI